MDFSAYEKGNPFMSYNHIQIGSITKPVGFGVAVIVPPAGIE